MLQYHIRVVMLLACLAGMTFHADARKLLKVPMQDETTNETISQNLKPKQHEAKVELLKKLMKDNTSPVRSKQSTADDKILRKLIKERIKRFISIPSFSLPKISLPSISIDIPSISLPSPDSILSDIQEGIDDIVPDISDIGDVLSDVRSAISDAASGLTSALDDIIPDELLADLAEDILDEIEDFEFPVDALEGAVEDLGGFLEDTGDFLSEVFDETGDFLGDIFTHFDSLVDDIGTGLEDAFEHIKEGAEDVGTFISDTYKHNIKEVLKVYAALACSIDKSKCPDTSPPKIQCYMPKNAQGKIIYAEEGEIGAHVYWDDASAEGDTGIKRIYQRFIDGYPAIRSGDFLEFGAYVVVYVAEENSGQAEVCHFSFLVHAKICGVFAPAESTVNCSYEGTHKDKRYTTWGQVCHLRCEGTEEVKEYKCLDDQHFLHEGEKTKRMKCEEDPTDGQWSSWTQCSTTCGEGQQRRWRKCQPNDGNNCVSNAVTEARNCSNAPCPKCPDLPTFPDMAKITLRPYRNDVIASFNCRLWTISTGKFPTSRCGESTGYQWLPEITEKDFPSCLRTKMATRIELQNEIAFTSSTQLMPLIKSSAKHPLHSKTDEIVRSATCSALSQCSLQVSLEYGDGEMQHVPENSFGRKKRETWQLAFKHLFKVFESFYVEGYLGENNASAQADVSVLVRFLLDVEVIKNETSKNLNAGSLDFTETGVQYSALRDTYKHHVNMECPVGFVPEVIYCVECPPGTYYKEKTCKPCPLGYFQPQRGALSCIACDKDFTTSHTGTKYSDKCVFKPLEGNFHESDREAFGESESEAHHQTQDSGTGLPQEVIIGTCAGAGFLAVVIVVAIMIVIVRRKKAKLQEKEEKPTKESTAKDNVYTP